MILAPFIGAAWMEQFWHQVSNARSSFVWLLLFWGLTKLITLISALISVIHIFLWIVLWLGLTAKRRWEFKLPPLETIGITGVQQPLLVSPQARRQSMSHRQQNHGEETIYWPKLPPSSPKLKVTFNDVPSTLSDNNLAEHDDKR